MAMPRGEHSIEAMPRGEGSELLVAVVLAAIGGYVDVICVIRYSTFVATMTGALATLTTGA